MLDFAEVGAGATCLVGKGLRLNVFSPVTPSYSYIVERLVGLAQPRAETYITCMTEPQLVLNCESTIVLC